MKASRAQFTRMIASRKSSVTIEKCFRAFGQKAAQAAVFLACLTLIGLGYVLGLYEGVLIPVTALPFLGLIADFEVQAFKIPAEKLTKFGALRECILQMSASLLAVPAVKLFIRNITGGLSSAHRSLEVNLSSSLGESLDSLINEKHTRIILECGLWMGCFHPSS